MCQECNAWRIQATNIWGQAYRKAQELKALVPLLPSPLKENEELILRNINWTPEDLSSGIQHAASICPLRYTPQEALEVRSGRAQWISTGEHQLSVLDSMVASTRNFLDNQAAIDAWKKMFNAYSESTNRMQANWQRTADEMSATTRAVGEGWLRIFRGS